MKKFYSKLAMPIIAAMGFALGAVSIVGGPTTAEAGGHIKKGGTLNFVVGSKIPSYDGHKETTFGMIHPIRPFYSLLIRVNPENPSSPDDFVCDLCEGSVLQERVGEGIGPLVVNLVIRER